jgi:DnaJ-class molecular chaperone
VGGGTGAKVKVPTPTGSIHLTIPKALASGKKMRLKGQGISAKVPGGLYVLQQVVLPPAEGAKATEAGERMKQFLAEAKDPAIAKFEDWRTDRDIAKIEKHAGKAEQQAVDAIEARGICHHRGSSGRCVSLAGI